MKALGLTNTQFLIAVIFGLLLAFVYIGATTPHPVEVPVQVITPVPTPPPVVIGSSSPAPVETTDETPWWLYSIGILSLIALVGIIAVGIINVGEMINFTATSPRNTMLEDMNTTMTAAAGASVVIVLLALAVYFVVRGVGGSQ